MQYLHIRSRLVIEYLQMGAAAALMSELGWSRSAGASCRLWLVFEARVVGGGRIAPG